MLLKFKKFRLCLLVLVLLTSFYIVGTAKIVGDCVFSVGPECRPAWWLRKGEKRFQATPFDWMMDYSLDTFVNCYKNKFSDFFENIKQIPKKDKKVANASNNNGVANNSNKNVSNVKNKRVEGDTSEHRRVKDTKNNIISIHHFKESLSLKDAQVDVREKMLRRGNKVDEIFNKSDTIILLANRQKESVHDLKKFINDFSALYPDKNVTLINVRNSNRNKVQEKVLYNGVASLHKIKQSGGKINRNSKTKPSSKKLQIIQYSFKNASPIPGKHKWCGNENGWMKVVRNIELTDKIFDKNMDLSKVEY